MENQYRATMTGADARDALVSSIAKEAAGVHDERATKELLTQAEALTDRLQKTVAQDSWQWRTHVISLAQLRERAGQLLSSARAWSHVAAVAPHRSDAMGKARALFLKANAFDEWLALVDSAAPRIGPRLAAAQTPQERAVLERGVPLLERFFSSPPSEPHTFLVQALDWDTLEALSKEGFAPGAVDFLEAFPDDWTQAPTFDGLLVLAPRRPCGFFVSGVNAKQTPRAKALLARATTVEGRFNRVIATWATPHSAGASVALEPAPVPSLARTPAEDRFAHLVRALLKDALCEAPGEVWTFEDAPWSTMESLAESLGAAFLDTRVNKAPSTREVLDQTRASRRTTTFGGHVVWPPRSDYRVTLTSLTTPATRVPAKWKKTADEVVARGKRLYLWWD